jgi:cytochrome oxidase Cu insertion factor (SCO1/SenC/PrrC family)
VSGTQGIERGAEAAAEGPPAAVSPGNAPLDRAGALARGAPKVPSHFVWWILGAVLALSLGGLLLERIFSSAGLDSASVVTTTTAANPVRAAPQTPAPPQPDRSLTAPLEAFMGLSSLSPRPASSFTLTDQHGSSLSVPPKSASAPPVVVLTFFDGPCNDICPVLADEIRAADSDLGTRATRVEFVTVNTDPTALAAAAQSAAVNTGLGALPNWHMVTGPLATLNAVWKAYGISISLSTATGTEAHTDVIEFIDPEGFVRYRATPFANESSKGVFTSPADTETRWGQGIASYAEKLIGQ